MKRKSALFATLVLTVSLLAGCGAKEEEKSPAGESGNQTTNNKETDDENKQAAKGSLKTGVGTVTSIGSSRDASADENGAGQADVVIAAVTVDADGKIAECIIDTAQTKVEIGADGKITTDLKTEFKTKQEIGDAYGMKKASSIGKEWYEQANAFAEYCIGKTTDEINGIAVNEGGAPSDADLAASVTISVGSFQQAVTKAAANAAELGAAAGDKLGLGVFTSISNSVDASAETEGEAQPNTTIAVTTVNGDGIITSSTIDGVQVKINFDTAGKITSDLTTEIASKNELGDKYGMKKASSIGKEWNEQAAAYAAYVTGKTTEEVKGIELNEGVPADTELAASVTIHVNDFNSVLEKAAANAK